MSKVKKHIIGCTVKMKHNSEDCIAQS